MWAQKEKSPLLLQIKTKEICKKMIKNKLFIK